MEQLSVSVLGSVRIARAGNVRRVGSRRQRALLAALALRHPRAVSVDELVDAVWGDDEPPDGARSTLQTYVSRLRSVVGEDGVVHGPAGYRLGDHVEVDAALARAALVDAEDLLDRDPATAVRLAGEALDRWDGTALAELAGAEWFEAAAVGLEELRLDLLDARAGGLVGCGRPAEAIDGLRASIVARPFHERTRVLLVRALADAGRSTDALRAADRYRTELRDATGLDPGPALAEMETAILAGSAAEPPGVRPSGRLPRPTRIVGRDAEITALAGLIDGGRLTTVLGTGGVGKTRLVSEVLAARTAHPAPAVVVELAAAAPDEVADAIAVALGYRAGRAEAQTLVDVLGSDPVLLVLDNCEHVLAAARGVVRAVLDGCDQVSIVVTSRTRLALAEEVVFPLEPLPTSGDRPPAVELFGDHLRRAHPAADLNVAGPDVRELCEQLDGIPLALQLAAGRAAVMGVRPLLDHLSTGELVAAPAAAGDDRHTSLRNVIAWSHDRLDPTAQRLLAALSVFERDFDLAAVEHVGGAVLGEPAAPAFGRLVDTCLVALGSESGAFRLLGTIRRFAAAHLDGADRHDAHRAHLRWVTACTEAIADAAWGPAEAEVGDLIDRLRADVRSAIGRAADQGDVPGLAALAGALAGPLLYRPDAELAGLLVDAAGRDAFREGDAVAPLGAAASRAAWLTGSLEVAEELARRATDREPGRAGAAAAARARHTLGVLALYRGRFDEAAVDFGAVVAEPAAKTADRVDALGGTALAACYGGDTEGAADAAARHRALAEAAGSRTAVAFADYIDGERALAAGRRDVAVESLSAAAAGAWDVGATFVWGLASTVLAATLVRGGEHDEAVRRLPLLLRRWRRTATWPQLWTSLRLVAEVLAGSAAPAEGLTVLVAAERDPAAPGVPAGDVRRLAEVRARLEQRLGPDGVAAATARAEVLDRREILDIATAALEGTAPSAGSALGREP